MGRKALIICVNGNYPPDQVTEKPICQILGKMEIKKAHKTEPGRGIAGHNDKWLESHQNLTVSTPISLILLDHLSLPGGKHGASPPVNILLRFQSKF